MECHGISRGRMGQGGAAIGEMKPGTIKSSAVANGTMKSGLPPPGHMASLQALRAIACLMVVLYHALQLGLGEAAIAAWPNLSAGVDVFFVLSGFVMAQSCANGAAMPRAAADFLRARLLRILPLYWGLTLLKLALLAARPGLARHTHPTPWNILASLAFIPARDAHGAIRPVLAVGWTLNFEMAFYLMISATLACGLRPGRIMPPLLIGLSVIGLWRQPDWPAPASLLHGFLAEFAAGMLLHGAWQGAARGRGIGLPAHWLGAAALLALLALPMGGALGAQARPLLWGGPAALLLLACLLHHAQHRHVPAALRVLGDASYAIYLLHGFVVPVITPAQHGPAGATAGLLALLGAAISLPFGIMLDRHVERPARRWLSARLMPPAASGQRPAAPQARARDG